jgi:hypothetical protein
MSLSEAGWGRLGGDYVRSFQAQAEAMSWNLDLRGLESPGETSLRFDAFDLPPDARIWLEDREYGWAREVSGGRSITLAARRHHRLRLTVTSGDAAEPEVRLIEGLRYVYPNPFRERSGLAFSLVGARDLEAQIYDVHGRSVRKLSASGPASGERVLIWDGRDETGKRAAPGVYLARYRVGDSRGVARLVKIE